jgi:Domain of unknown function (DUF6378)
MEREAVLHAALKACMGARQDVYGRPEDNFSRIAKLASIAMQREFTTVDVVLFMLCVKLARISNMPTHDDSWIDMAGYAACGSEIADAGVRRDAVPEGASGDKPMHG